MLAQLKMKLELPKGYCLNHNKSSLFQGVLMEMIDSEYAVILHEGGINPYSISLSEERKDEWYWIVNTLTAEAYEKIIPKLLDDSFESVYLRYDKKTIKITEKSVKKFKMASLLNQFNTKNASGSFNITFKTPAAFKVNGEYLFLPDLQHIFQSIINRFDSLGYGFSLVDKETIEELEDKTKITAYNLHDEKFGLEGVKIPSFMGNMTVRVNGSQELKNFVSILLEFASYSGIGIKTSIGMGSVGYEEIIIKK